MGIIGSVVGGILGSNAAGNAASTESNAAKQAQALEQQNQQQAQTAQQTALTNTTNAEQPYQTLGSTSANNLTNLLSTGFQAPTLQQAEQTPGYAFNLSQGTQAIDQNAAANGTLMSGNTGKALEQFGQGLATTTYQQAYQNALNSYMANYQTLQGGTNTGLSSTGQLANANLGVAGNLANIDLTGGQQQAQQINNAAAARASGYLGQAGALSNMFGGLAGAGGSVAEGLQGGGGLSDVESSLAGGGFF
jgi:hypothetical protein